MFPFKIIHISDISIGQQRQFVMGDFVNLFTSERVAERFDQAAEWKRIIWDEQKFVKREWLPFILRGNWYGFYVFDSLAAASVSIIRAGVLPTFLIAHLKTKPLFGAPTRSALGRVGIAKSQGRSLFMNASALSLAASALLPACFTD